MFLGWSRRCGLILPPPHRNQATSRSPALLGLKEHSSQGLRFDSRTGHLGCGHYVVRSCTLSCFHSYPRLKLTFTIIAMQKSRSHPPFILYEDCLTMWADLRELDYNVVACTRKQILRLQDISKGSGLYFYPSQWQSGKITACHPKGLRFDSRTGHLGCGHYVVRSCTLGCFHSYPRLKLTFTINAEI